MHFLTGISTRAIKLFGTKASASLVLGLSMFLSAGAGGLPNFQNLSGQAIPTIKSPREALGFDIGQDYHLANYAQLVLWWKELAAQSDRMELVDIGKTEEGRTQYMAVLTSPENHRRLNNYKDIARKLALAEGLSDAQARELAKEGKAVVWIDGGLHGNEVLGAQQLLELVYQMVSLNDPETLRILNDVILLAVLANPDGMDLVSDWYMREKDPEKRSTANIPRLYQKYAGHDNNRDSYMANLSETTNMNHQLFIEWFPQIMYNHHQSGPAGTVMFAPPFRDPFNYNIDPLVMMELNLVAAAMHSRFVSEGKAGVTMRGGANFSAWYNGGLRTITYFHNMVGILTETIGNPTPLEIPLMLNRQLPSGDLPLPVPPQRWHFRQSVEYSISANRAILDLASKYREDFLFNIYRMGKNSIERGSRDNWTISPKGIQALKDAIAPEIRQQTDGDLVAVARATNNVPSDLYKTALQSHERRDPRGYILSADQADFPTATVFINALIKNGIAVHQATAPFQVNGKSYPKGSWVVKTAQAFRPHIMDMFEPQDHPEDFLYPGGPPVPPYDVAGWTLAMQMGVQYDRILDAFDGPFQKVNGVQPPMPARVSGPARAVAGYMVSHSANNSFIIQNRVFKSGGSVFWFKDSLDISGVRFQPGGIYIPDSPGMRPLLEKAASELGVEVLAVAQRPRGEAQAIVQKRIGLWDQFGGSMSSGWLRFIFDQFEFPYEVVFPPALDAGKLIDRFDVLVLPDGAIQRLRAGVAVRQAIPEADLPAEYRGRQGRITIEATLPKLIEFANSGGTIVAMGSSSSIGEMMGLGVTNALTEITSDGRVQPLPREKYYIPGSILQVAMDNSQPLAYGMGKTANVVFNNSPTYRLSASAIAQGAKAVAWFDSPNPLQSGWIYGGAYLDGTFAAIDHPHGKGRLCLIGPEATFRAQPHGTFKLLFNAIYM
ncbi:MAG: M14 family metallopeptidase [Holophagaceae bacterium]|nr:M14 family metallopeptidase [Holophagaceae bacterium]